MIDKSKTKVNIFSSYLIQKIPVDRIASAFTPLYGL